MVIELVILLGFIICTVIGMNKLGILQKYEKQTYLFEDENGNKDNPFTVDEEMESESDESSWKYSV